MSLSPNVNGISYGIQRLDFRYDHFSESCLSSRLIRLLHTGKPSHEERDCTGLPIVHIPPAILAAVRSRPHISMESANTYIYECAYQCTGTSLLQ